jgi:hypothetical protein
LCILWPTSFACEPPPPCQDHCPPPAAAARASCPGCMAAAHGCCSSGKVLRVGLRAAAAATIAPSQSCIAALLALGLPLAAGGAMGLAWQQLVTPQWMRSCVPCSRTGETGAVAERMEGGMQDKTESGSDSDRS